MSVQEVELRLPYHPLPWQWRVKRDPRRFQVVVAGRRSGKTKLDADDLTIGAATVPNSVNWYVGPTYSSAKDIAWDIFKLNLKDFFRWGLIDKVVESDLLIRLKNGAVIQLKGGDKPDSLRGVKLNRLAVDEYAIMKSEVWEEVLQPATADMQAHVTFTGTPKGYNHFHALYKMQDKSPADWKSWLIKTSEAGTIPQEEIERARRDMDPRVFRQEYEASFETFGGQVFSDFDRKKHVSVEPIAFSPGQEYCLGMDFGWSAPTVVLFINVDAQENVTVFAELLRRETSIPQIALDIKNQTKGLGRDQHGRPMDALPSLIGCDPAGDARNEALGTSSVEELRNFFSYQVVQYRRKYPGVIQDRINQIRKWLRNGKLKISCTCTSLIQAFEMYRYPDPKGDIQSEMPLKDGISDHPIDALGEFFLNRFPVQVTSVRAI